MVNCNNGRSRTGAVIAAYLMKHLKLSAKNAIEVVDSALELRGFKKGTSINIKGNDYNGSYGSWLQQWENENPPVIETMLKRKAPDDKENSPSKSNSSSSQENSPSKNNRNDSKVDSSLQSFSFLRNARIRKKIRHDDGEDISQSDQSGSTEAAAPSSSMNNSTKVLTPF